MWILGPMGSGSKLQPHSSSQFLMDIEESASNIRWVSRIPLTVKCAFIPWSRLVYSSTSQRNPNGKRIGSHAFWTAAAIAAIDSGGGFPAKVLALHHTSANNRWDWGWTFCTHDFPNKSSPCTPFHIQTNIPIALLILFCIPVPMAGVNKSKITNMPHICKAGFVVKHNYTFLYLFLNIYICIYLYLFINKYIYICIPWFI